MKKRLLLFLILILQVTLFGQPLTRDNYLFLVNSSSKRNCPLYDDGCEINNMTYKSNVLHFNVTVPEKLLRGHSVDDVRKYLSERLIHRQEWYVFTYIYDHLTDVKGALSYDFRIADDNKQFTDSSFSICFTTEEYRAIKVARSKSNTADNKAWKARQEVELMVKEINRLCPKPIDSYLTMSSVSILGDKVAFVFVFKERDNVTFSTVKASRDNLERNIAKSFQAEKETFADIIYAGYGILYAYLDEQTKESFEIFFSNSRLKELLAQSKVATKATDAQMDAFMVEFAQRFLKSNQRNADSTTMWMTSGEYENRVLQFTMMANEDVYNFDLTPDELEVYKKSIAFSVRSDIENMLRIPEIYDGAIVALEHFYQHLKGVRLLILENNTHRGEEIFYTTDELMTAEPFEIEEFEPDTMNSENALDMLRVIVTETQTALLAEYESLGLDSIALDEQYLTYYLAVPDNYDYANAIQEYVDNYASFKESMKQNWVNGDQNMMQLLLLCALARRGLRYQYSDGQGRKVEFIFSVEEIEEILEEQE